MFTINNNKLYLISIKIKYLYKKLISNCIFIKYIIIKLLNKAKNLKSNLISKINNIYIYIFLIFRAENHFLSHIDDVTNIELTIEKLFFNL